MIIVNMHGIADRGGGHGERALRNVRQLAAFLASRQTVRRELGAWGMEPGAWAKRFCAKV